jgi:dTDP-4-amino-4,6-dideoxygalactose transaminase
MIQCSNPLAQYLAQKDQIDAAIARVLAKGLYILGDEVRGLEEEFAAFNGVHHGVGVGSGTEALHLALRTCGIAPGSEVITVSHTAVATVAAIELAGAAAVLVDVEPGYGTIDCAAVEAAITPRTAAIVIVHLYGQSADMKPLMTLARRDGLRVIEDCAQAHGARYRGKSVGSIGDIGCFSFYPTKNLGAVGDGGMLITNSSEDNDRARALREYGWQERYVSRLQGWNTRLDELQAAILRVKLRALETDNAAREHLANRYDDAFAGLPLSIPRRRPDCRHVFHLYVVRTEARDALRDHLKARGINALIHYPVPIHLQPAYAGRVRLSGSLGETERTASEVLSLPMYPQLSEAEQDKVIAVVQDFFARRV